MKEKANEIVYSIIRNKLITGEWPRGSKITGETELAKQTGVSRSTVREAIERFVTAGVLVRRQGDGTYVRDISPLVLMTRLQEQDGSASSLLETLDYREMVEPEAVKRLIRNDDRENLNVMITTLDEMQRHSDLRVSDDFSQADTRFHFAILRGAHNPILDQTIHLIQEALICYQYSANQLIGAKTGIEEHAAIVNAVYQKDEELAALLVRRHIQRGRRDLIKCIEPKQEKEGDL